MGAAEQREHLVTLVRRQADETECWKRGETVLRAVDMRQRLADLGVDATPEVAASFMAAAMLLAATSDEWGGDYRDALADLAALGLELFES
jgi:hypothetical protein